MPLVARPLFFAAHVSWLVSLVSFPCLSGEMDERAEQVQIHVSSSTGQIVCADERPRRLIATDALKGCRDVVIAPDAGM